MEDDWGNQWGRMILVGLALIFGTAMLCHAAHGAVF